MNRELRPMNPSQDPAEILHLHPNERLRVLEFTGVWSGKDARASQSPKTETRKPLLQNPNGKPL